MQTRFADADFKAFAEKGSATVTGQAFLKTRAGDVKFGAGNTVYLLPLTDYTRELRAHAAAIPQTARDPVLRYTRTVVADASGNFEFREIPPGDYVVECYIIWRVPGDRIDNDLGLNKRGGVASANVSATEGATIRVVVTRPSPD